MNKAPTLSPCIVPPAAGTVIRAFGEEVTILLGGKDTDGQFTMWTEVTPPGGGPPPHYHLNEDEWFFPMEGRVEFFKDNSWTEVPMGTAVFMPKGVAHAFRNPGEKPLKMLIHSTPSGFETFFARCAEEFTKSSPPDMARIIEISAEHGIHFVNS
ncbi:cupin domain-containing protein [Verrucomicrobiota bacterium sgz303538]